MLTGYKAVFFDVGGTLLSVHPSVGEVYARYARPFGFEGDPAVLNTSFRDQWKAMGGMESLGRSSGVEVEKGFWKELVRRVFDPYGIEDFDNFFEHLYEVFKQAEAWKVFDDVVESQLLETLKGRGIKLGVISNWDSRLPEILSNTGLAQYFDFILASTVVGSAKPDTLIFEEALKRSGVEAHEACHIGDEIPTDIQGATGAGLSAILIDRRNRGANHTPTIQSFHELI